MLLFISKVSLHSCKICDVSIHLMLLFIGIGLSIQFCIQKVSIHLMLLFIFLVVFLMVKWSGFNTSHVTLYLDQTNNAAEVYSFQYISCYSLSVMFRCQAVPQTVSIHLMLLFIGYTSKDSRRSG